MHHRRAGEKPGRREGRGQGGLGVMGGRSTLREPTLILLSIVAFCAISSTWFPVHTVPAMDFYQFWVVGQEVTAGQPGDVYSDLERRRIGQHFLDQAPVDGDSSRQKTAKVRAVLQTFSTPFLYTVFGSLSSGDYDHDLSTYRTFSLLLLALSVAALCRLLGYGAAPTIAAITLFGSWFAPSRADMILGNVNHFQLGGLVLFLWLSCRFPTTAGHLAGGFLLGLGAMFKPNTALAIGLLLVAWTVRRRHRKLVLESLGMAAGSLAAFAWSSAVFGGPYIWRSWLSALSRLPDGIMTEELGNYAPDRLLSDWLQVDTGLAIGLVCVGVGLAAIGRGLWGAVPEDAHDRPGLEDVLVVAVAGLVTLLSSPLSWLHYFVAAIPMLLVALRPASGLQAGGVSWIIARATAFVALLAIMKRPLVLLDVGDMHSRTVFLCVGTLLLFGLGVRELLAFREESADAPDEA